MSIYQLVNLLASKLVSFSACASWSLRACFLTSSLMHTKTQIVKYYDELQRRAVCHQILVKPWGKRGNGSFCPLTDYTLGCGPGWFISYCTAYISIGFWRARFVIRNTHMEFHSIFSHLKIWFRFLVHGKVLWHSVRVIYCARFFIIGFWRAWWFINDKY